MTTLEQLKALSDEELTERLAVEVMGWHKGEAQWLDSGGNGMASLPNSYCVDCGQIFDWNPLTDSGHTIEVIRRLESQGYEVILTFLAGLITVEIAKPEDSGSTVEKGAEFGRAVVLCALQAIENR